VSAVADTVETGVKAMAGDDRHGDEDRRRKHRNWALFAVLLAFVVLIYFVSIVRMGMNTP
jgi:hypothetical protein